MDCRTPIVSSMIAGPGQPGGTLPAGGEQWSFLQFNGTLWVPSSWVVPETVTALDTGEVLMAVNAAAEFQEPLADLLLYRNHATTLSATTPWMAQWYGTVSFATIETAGFAVALRDGLLRWMRVFHSTPVAADEVLTYTVHVNGAPTALSAQLNVNQEGPGQNLVDTVPVVTGDLISMRVDGVTTSRAARAGVDFFLD